MLTHPPSEPTPPSSDGGNRELPPPPFLSPKDVGPTFQAAAQPAERPHLTLSLTSPVSPRQTRDKDLSPFKAPKSHDWRDPDSPYFGKMNKVRETITTALRRQSYIKEFKRDDIPPQEHCPNPKTHSHLTELLGVRDRLEDKLMILLDDPGDIEKEYESLSKGVNAINRSMYDLYVVYLRPTPRSHPEPKPAHTIPGITSTGADQDKSDSTQTKATRPIVDSDKEGITKSITPSLPHGRNHHHTFRQAAAVNPAARPVQEAPLTYLEAFGAEITTATSAQHHETRIYQPGYTPGEIRSNIKLILRTISPQQHMLDFPSRDIPPKRVRILGKGWWKLPPCW